MAERSVIFDLQLDVDNLNKNAQLASKRLQELKEQQKLLKDEGKQNTVEYAKLSNEIRNNNKILKDSTSAIEINNRLQKSNNGTLAEMREALKAGSIAYAQLTKEERENEEIGGRLQKQNADLKTSINELEQAQKNFTGSVGNYKEATNEVLEEQKKLSTQLSGIGQQLEGVGGSAGQAVGGVKSLSASFKALLANPVVLVISAIVAVLATLYKSFTRTEEGGNKMNKLFTLLNGVFSKFMQILEPVAEFLVDSLVSAFSAVSSVVDTVIDGIADLASWLGFEQASQGIKNMTNSAKELVKQTNKIADEEAALIKLRREQQKIQLQYQLDAEKLRQIRDDEARSFAERIKANEDLGKLLDEQAKRELSIANRELANIQRKIKLEGETTELLDARAEAETQIIDIQERIAGQQSEQLTNINSLRREQNALIEEQRKLEIELANTLTDIILENEERTTELQQAIIDKKYESLIRSAEGYNDEIIELERQRNEELKQLDNERENNAIATLQEQLRRDLEANKNNLEIRRELERAFELDKAKIQIEFDKREQEREFRLQDLIAKNKVETTVETEEKVQDVQEESNAIDLEAEKEKQRKKVQLALTSANQLSGALFQIVQARLTRELNAVTANYDQQTDALNDQLEQGVITESEYLNQKAQLEEQYREEERQIKQEQFKRQKQADLIQSIINTAVGVTQAIPNPALMALAGVLGATQTALIASQPVPQFAKGGVFGGNPHSAGGTKGYFSDGTQIEVEKDEAFFVLNKKATSKIGALSRLNQSTGGVPLMQDGGAISFNSGVSAIALSSQIDSKNNTQNDLLNAISKLPPPIVAVQDINEAQSSYSQVVNFASF